MSVSRLYVESDFQECTALRSAALWFDISGMVFSAFFAMLLREDFIVPWSKVQQTFPYLVATGLLSVFVFFCLGFSRGSWRLAGLRHLLQLALSIVAIIIGASTVTFAYNQMDGLFRSLPILHLMTAIIALATGRICVVIWYRRFAVMRLTNAMHSVGVAEYPSAIVIGHTSFAEAYLRAILEAKRRPFAIAGIVDSGRPGSGRDILGFPLLGKAEDLELILADLETRGIIVDRLIVAARPSDMSQDVRSELQKFECADGRRVDHLFDLLGLDDTEQSGVSDPAAQTSVRTTMFPSLQEQRRPMSWEFHQALRLSLMKRSFWPCKRLIDFGLALFLLLTLSPIMALTACLVLLDVGRPIIFWQVRPGRSGYSFRLYKFRTMRPSYSRQGRRLTDEEHVSIVGSFLRRSRLDELPQLFNILLGEMLFVGPRPLLPIDQPPGFHTRLVVRPGLTGWAQVQSVRSIAAADKAALDIWYIQHASLGLDLWIALRTIPILLFGERTNYQAIEQSWHELERVGIDRPKCPLDGTV